MYDHVSLSLTIDTGNAAAVDDPYEAVPAMLEDAARRIRDHRTSGHLRDVNGNTAGDYVLTLSLPEESTDDVLAVIDAAEAYAVMLDDNGDTEHAARIIEGARAMREGIDR